MDSAALSLLELPEARRIASTWPSVASGLVKKLTPKLLSEWARSAAVAEEMVAMTHPGLFRSGILSMTGTIDPTAAKFITAAAFSAARIQAKRDREKERKT